MENVKKSWIVFVGKIMPCMNKSWNDDSVKITSLLSKHTSPSDEALAVTAIEKKIHFWITQGRGGDDLDVAAVQNNNQRGKVMRDKWTEDDIKKFYEKQIEL